VTILIKAYLIQRNLKVAFLFGVKTDS